MSALYVPGLPADTPLSRQLRLASWDRALQPDMGFRFSILRQPDLTPASSSLIMTCDSVVYG